MSRVKGLSHREESPDGQLIPDSLLQAMPFGLCVVDDQFNIAFVNSVFLERCGKMGLAITRGVWLLTLLGDVTLYRRLIDLAVKSRISRALAVDVLQLVEGRASTSVARVTPERPLLR